MDRKETTTASSPYRKVICICGLLMVFINMGMLSTAFSVYFPYLREMRGFSNTQVSLLTTIRYVSSLFVMAVSDRYYRAMGIKKGVAVTFLNSFCAYLMYAFASAHFMYHIASLMFGISYGLGAIDREADGGSLRTDGFLPDGCGADRRDLHPDGAADSE